MRHQLIVLDPFREDVKAILAESDAYMLERYPPNQCYLLSPDELNKPNVLLIGIEVSADKEKVLAAIGAVKIEADKSFGEIKRMFVLELFRGKGYSRIILNYLEKHLIENHVYEAKLETGPLQPEALGLYAATGYSICGPYACYQPNEGSVFMEKRLSA